MSNASCRIPGVLGASKVSRCVQDVLGFFVVCSWYLLVFFIVFLVFSGCSWCVQGVMFLAFSWCVHSICRRFRDVPDVSKVSRCFQGVHGVFVMCSWSLLVFTWCC